ncbi:hypothetical protein [Xanthomonas hortorum]|uniref:hypothetical protein n=1 Tax=Xanthomonas hortorum TaxID=56454 RepID=UPI002935B2EC|nr:hypothetical protein [Xanthomonas hortorum]MDV2449661.1 hypothetical protein [Xanthomonas hortorum NBC5720]
MKFNNVVSNQRLLVIAGLVALTTAACSQKSAETTESATPTPATSAQAPADPGALAPALATFETFTGTLPTEVLSKECSLDALDGQVPPPATVELKSDGSAALGGWAGNGAGQSITTLHLVLKGASQSYSTAIKTWVARQDVATALNAPALANSGYEINISLKGVAPGEYAVYVADPADLQKSLCDLGHKFQIK